MSISAESGFSVTAPGGIDLIDSSYWSISSTAGTVCGQQTNLVGNQINGTILKNDFNIALTTVNAVSFTATGMDFSAMGVVGNATGTEVGTVGVQVTSGGIMVELSGTIVKN